MTTQLKICGIRSLSEIQELKDLPIDYFGCIFAPKSPRYVSVDLAKDIVTEIHSVGKLAVGVFVNTSIQELQQIQQQTNIDILQLHGNESVEDCSTLHSAGYTLWKAFSVYDTLLLISLIFNILYSIPKALLKVVTALDLIGKYLKTYRLILIF